MGGRTERCSGAVLLQAARLVALRVLAGLGPPYAHSLGCAREDPEPGALHSLGGGTSGPSAALGWGEGHGSLFHEITRSGGIGLGPLQKNLVLVKRLC